MLYAVNAAEITRRYRALTRNSEQAECKQVYISVTDPTPQPYALFDSYTLQGACRRRLRRSPRRRRHNDGRKGCQFQQYSSLLSLTQAETLCDILQMRCWRQGGWCLRRSICRHSRRRHALQGV